MDHERIERRGRPSMAHTDPETRPKQFVKEYKDYTGHRSIWTWDLTINPFGPISVEEIYPEGSEEARTEEVIDEHLPKTQRRYWNPESQKYVGYVRAYNLGLLPKD